MDKMMHPADYDLFSYQCQLRYHHFPKDGTCSDVYGCCLDFNFNPIPCISMLMCAFTFLCPPKFVQKNYLCELKYQSSCPDISSLSYRLEYIEGLNNTNDLQQGNLSASSYYNNNNQINSEIRKCEYSRKDYFANGVQVGELHLDFNIVHRELILKTEGVPLEYIRCYSRAHRKVVLHIQTEYTNYSYYKLDIDVEPRTYFCYIQAPFLYIPYKTKEMIGYRDTSLNKYILKLSHSADLQPISSWLPKYLLDLFNDLGFEECRRFHETHNETYFFIQGGNYGDIKLINETIIKVMDESKSIKYKNSIYRVRNWKIEYLRNIYMCPPETTTSKNGTDVHWSETLIGTMTTPSELCLNEGGIPVTRKCVGDIFTGAYWLEPSENCSIVVVSNRTRYLHNLRQISEEKPEKISEVLSNITTESEEFSEFTVTDVNLLAETIKTISKQHNASYSEEELFGSVNNMLKINAGILKESQERLNSTDKILDSIDNFALNFAKDFNSMNKYENVLIQTIYPFVSNITGLAVYNGDNFLKSEIVNIYRSQTFDSLNLENLEVAVYVPDELIESLTSNLTNEEKRNFKIINTIFQDDRLFNEIHENCKVLQVTSGKIINVKIPGYPNKFNTTIPILIRPSSKKIEEPDCVYWDYGQQKYGKWSTYGGTYLDYNLFHSQKHFLKQCSYNHLTNFALLVLSEESIFVKQMHEYITIKEDKLGVHTFSLTLITFIGCSLSIIGIIGILFSACKFKKWYTKRMDTIYLSVIMLFECILLLIADPNILTNSTTCKVFGAILHYIVLAKFVWMLLISHSQYLKFVNIYKYVQAEPNTWQHNLIGWLLPLVPIVISAIFLDDYNSSGLHICYAKDVSFTYLLCLPVIVIILLNFIIYIKIIISVFKSKTRKQVRQIHLAIMLLFMLGITWGIGFFAEILPWNLFKFICIYSFCILGSIQGFVIFVFVVILNENTVNLWKDMLKYTPKFKFKFELKKQAKPKQYYIKNQVICEQIKLVDIKHNNRKHLLDF